MSQAVNGRKLLVLAGLLLLAMLFIVSPAWPLETRSGDQVVIESDEVIEDDLYVTANELIVDGTIRGDLIALGNSITVDGTVEGDLAAAGQTVEIGGTLEDDARIAGRTLLLAEGASVADDLVAAAFSLENEPDSVVGGTVLYAGYQTLLAGTVDEDVSVTANGLTVSGEIGGNLDADVDGEDAGPPPFVFTPQADIPAVEPGLTLTGSAQIGGDVTYESSTAAQIDPGAQIEGEVFATERPVEEEPTLADAVLDNLRSFVSLLLVGLLLVWLAPRSIRRVADTVRTRPLPSLGWGVLAYVVFIVLAIIVLLATILLAIIFGLLTLGGLVPLIIALGALIVMALGLVFWISTSYLAQIVVSFLVGRWLLERISPDQATGRVLPLVVGLILYVILRAIPVLGWIVGLVVVLLGLGAIFSWLWTTLRRRPAQSPPAS